MPNVTPNYGLYLPLVNNVTDQDLWGGYLNSNFSTLDTLMATFEVPAVGKIEFFPFNAPPNGYLECAGQTVSRTTYAALWAVAQASGNIVADASWDLGMFSTGDLSTTFRIPDYRGELLRGWDHGKGTDPSRAIGTSQADAIASHSVTITDSGHNHPSADGNNFMTQKADFALQSGGGNVYSYGSGPHTGTNTTGITAAYTGATETRGKNVAGMFCIKT